MHHYIYMLDGPRKGKHLSVTDERAIKNLIVGWTFRYLDQSYRIVSDRGPGVWGARLDTPPLPEKAEGETA